MSTPAKPLLNAESLNLRLSETAGIHNISLTLQRGDVLGLLGLNGAGKSTTLRLLAGTLAPDSGSVVIAGHSLHDEPLKARARLGYLPDQPPLYNDMRITEYLKFSARLRRVPSANVMARVNTVMTQCDLHSMSSKRIVQLSKGYRQRVGLAQALVHQPDVLLLDEPSSGLDPNQMQGMRKVIKDVGQEHAVVFSTHLLNEAQEVCNRIAVVHQGKLIHEAPVTSNNKELEALFTGLVQDEPAAVNA